MVPWQSQSVARPSLATGAVVVPSIRAVSWSSVPLALSPIPSQSTFSTARISQANPYYTGYCPVPARTFKLSLSQHLRQVTAVWWLRFHLGSCFSRKPILSWSSCPVFQLLLCRLKLMGEPRKRVLCFVTSMCQKPPPRLSLITSDNPEVKTCPSILDTAYPPVIFKLILLI